MRTRERVILKMGHINIESICMYCNDEKFGCVTADDKPIPCHHERDCACDTECICECHDWQRVVRFARTCLETAERKLGIANEH